tara:strand:- start:297 stop:473 length:177 start_codon:yes stop_codon:yes gene_type:complete
VIKTSSVLVLKLRFEDAKTLGIIKKIINGLVIPPVKKISPLNCIISIKRYINADLSDS